MVGAKPRWPAAFAARLARPSAVPVWEPKRMVSGVSGGGGRGGAEALTPVATELREIADRYATDQLGIVTICFDFKARLRSYERVADRLRDRASPS